jgi:hypothetical protein
MLYDLDNTLAALLEQELPSELLATTQISFAAPDGESVGSKPAINLFLYDVRENLELRSGVDSFERRGDGTAVRLPPAVRVDCSYLITFWPRETGEQSSPRNEHRYLGKVMTALLRHRKLPAAVLQGELAGQEPPLHAVSLQSGYLSNMVGFWQAMGGKPRLAINYTVTISVPVHGEGETVPLVVERRLAPAG